MRIVIVALALCSCQHMSMEQQQFRDARKARSVVPLARFAEEHPDTKLAARARQLIVKHYDHALADLGTEAEADFKRILLAHLRRTAQPRILVSVDRPHLDPAAGAELDYFSEPHYYEGGFCDAANRVLGRSARYPVLQFKHDYDYDFKASEEDVSLYLRWKVEASGQYFEGPSMNWSDPSARTAVPGITIRGTLRFYIPGQPEPFEFPVQASPSSFNYEAFLGMPARADLFSGMAETAFEQAFEGFWTGEAGNRSGD